MVPLSRVGRVGVRITQTGLVLMALESLASQIHAGSTLGPVFMLGLLLTLIGFLVSGIDGMTCPGARWIALLPLVAFVIAIGAGDRGGFLVPGLAWGGLCLGAPTGSNRASRTASRSPLPVSRGALPPSLALDAQPATTHTPERCPRVKAEPRHTAAKRPRRSPGGAVSLAPLWRWRSLLLPGPGPRPGGGTPSPGPSPGPHCQPNRGWLARRR